MWHAAIAHELRTPVTILRGRLQGLAEGVFQPDESQFRSLLAQVEGLSRLIEDLRVLSLSDNARLDVRRARTDVVAEVHSVMTLVDPQFRTAGFVLELETSREEHNAHCDPTRLRQALLALLENARRYASPGKVRIAVHDTPGHVQVAIEDEGPGIDPALHADIFTPFMRADGSRSRQGGGSGLGLAVVKAIADAHGGRASWRPACAGEHQARPDWHRSHPFPRAGSPATAGAAAGAAPATPAPPAHWQWPRPASGAPVRRPTAIHSHRHAATYPDAAIAHSAPAARAVRHAVAQPAPAAAGPRWRAGRPAAATVPAAVRAASASRVHRAWAAPAGRQPHRTTADSGHAPRQSNSPAPVLNRDRPARARPAPAGAPAGASARADSAAPGRRSPA
ncbi:hypothetical protein G6F57_015336 [Rhizopus arrhizus]|nr:hypothetical protein G6F57_015336 [Rhizopus arrhizus]